MGDTPGVVAADTLLSPGEIFQQTDACEAELVPLAVWPLADDTARALPTINDLALGPDDRVYALSAETRMIARLEQHLEPGQRARVTDTWRIDGQIPGSHDARPEVLAILPSGRPLVGIDTKLAGHNLVVLQRLDGL